MIKLTAKINILSGTSEEYSGSINFSGNNISSDFSSIVGEKKRAKNPFIIGSSKIGDGATIENSVDYFVGSNLASEKGAFSPPYTINLSANGIEHLTIAFDTEKNRYPNTIIVDGVSYPNDDSIFTVVGLSTSKALHTILIPDWNTPNFPLVITGIYIGVDLDIDYSVLKSLEAKHTDRASNEMPSYGIISNVGSVSFRDKNGEIKDYAEQQLLKSNLKVDITLKDTLSKKKEQVGSFSTSDWEYDVENKEVQIKLKDNLEEMQGIYLEGLDLILNKNQTARTLYIALQGKTPTKFGFKSIGELDDFTRQILSNTKINKYWLEDGTLWQQWNKLAHLCGAHIYQDFLGNTIFKVSL